MTIDQDEVLFHTRDVAALEENMLPAPSAVDGTPPDRPDYIGRLGNLSTQMAERFAQTQNMQRLRKSLVLTQKTIAIMSQNHTDFADQSHSLGSQSRKRFLYIGELSDIDEAVALMTRAVYLTPGDSQILPGRLHDLALALGDKYSFTGQVLASSTMHYIAMASKWQSIRERGKSALSTFHWLLLCSGWDLILRRSVSADKPTPLVDRQVLHVNKVWKPIPGVQIRANLDCNYFFRCRVPGKQMHVLCLGLSQSDTGSLRSALMILGYSDVYHGFLITALQREDCAFWVALMRRKPHDPTNSQEAIDFDSFLANCEAVTDGPANVFGEELLSYYPNAKVILNRRRDVDAWGPLCEFLGKPVPDVPFPDGNKGGGQFYYPG
ncbi:hypothetical protein FCIRC_4254 [Fusarium circinatum]|uniref:Uncharacterized protein n=1 Tax=Fusarium circinatum TaxID=48490 RepID=A0A8H5X573_FUSCI|nr:hypothetical protein FCIRC_4254 [Fusarium circinatum]